MLLRALRNFHSTGKVVNFSADFTVHAESTRSGMRDFSCQLAQLTEKQVSPSVEKLLTNMGDHLTESTDRNLPLPPREQVGQNPLKLSSKSELSGLNFVQPIAEEMKAEIIQALFIIFDARRRWASEFGLNLTEINKSGGPFHVTPSRYAVCMSGIEKFCINQVVRIWQSCGEISRSSFAINVRQLRVCEVNDNNSAALTIHYRKSGGTQFVKFSKTDPLLDDSSELSVCAWQLGRFIEQARLILGKDSLR